MDGGGLSQEDISEETYAVLQVIRCRPPSYLEAGATEHDFVLLE